MPLADCAEFKSAPGPFSGSSTVGPVSGAEARVVFMGNSAVTTLDFSPGAQTISGHLSGDTNGQPAGSNMLTEARSEGNFAYTFMVSEATPFTLTGQLGIQGRFVDDVGRAELRLTEDGVRIAGGAIFPVPTVPGVFLPIADAGTLLPGRTYALTGSMVAPIVVEPLGNLEFSNSDVEFTLTVPEPTAVGLLVPAALQILSSRGRRRPGAVGLP